MDDLFPSALPDDDEADGGGETELGEVLRILDAAAKETAARPPAPRRLTPHKNASVSFSLGPSILLSFVLRLPPCYEQL